MKAWQFILILAIIIGISIYASVTYRSDRREFMEAVDAAKATHINIINVDSIRSEVEKSVRKSLQAEIDQQDRLINKMQSDLKKQTQRNEELYNLYRSRHVSMPEF